MSEKGRKPDYILKAIDPATGKGSGRLGAAWMNGDGSISINLDMCVVLDARDNLVYRLFTNLSKEKSNEVD